MTHNDSRMDNRRSKVSRMIDKYALDGMEDRLPRSWRGEDEPQRSLRELADYFNRELLNAAMSGAGFEPLKGELANMYRLLTDDAVTAADRTEAETKLSRAGLDVETLRQDFVSHQAIHTYLRKHREVEPPTSREPPAELVRKRSQTIQRLRNRLVAVTERTFGSLRDAGHLTLGSFEVFATVTVHCNECDTSHDVVDVLNQRGCECRMRAEPDNEAGR